MEVVDDRESVDRGAFNKVFNGELESLLTERRARSPNFGHVPLTAGLFARTRARVDAARARRGKRWHQLGVDAKSPPPHAVYEGVDDGV